MAHILVIEDNEINLELMTFLLQAGGHRTASAGDGAAGLALARREPPDLVLCDIQMPGLDGHGVAAAMRADPLLRSIPLIAVTASAMVGDREQALASGFDAHVSKPIDPQTFLALVDEHLPTGRAVAPLAGPMSPSALGVVPAELRAPRDGVVLLLVDDKTNQLEFKRDLLEPAGYRVHCVTRAEDAWSLLGDTAVDLVLSDVVMPGVGGYALLARVRADPRLQSLPFVFLTSTACDAASKEEGLALGADAYLIRPMAPLDLLREIRAALEAPARG